MRAERVSDDGLFVSGASFSTGENITSAGFAVLADGSIVQVGRASASSSSFTPDYDAFFVVRYAGSATVASRQTDLGTPGSFDGESAGAVAVQADNRIVMAGTSDGDVAVLRYNADLSLDATFDGDGILLTDFGSTADHASNVVLQSDGKILIAAGLGGAAPDGFIARFNSDGTLDTTFDGDGSITIDFHPSRSALALQVDG